MKNSNPIIPKRYHPALVSLHWIIAILIIANVILAGAAEDDATIAGLPAIYFHMINGMTILILFTARIGIRMKTSHPVKADIGNPILNKIGVLTHWVLYLLGFGMTITGLMLAGQSNLFAEMFGVPGKSGGELRFELGIVHGTIWTLLLLTIVMHIGAALYHQFIRKDNLLSRMWFGKSK